MNDECDSLAAELAALSPRRTSASLEERLAAELAPTPGRRRLLTSLAWLAGGALAASLLAALWLWRGREETVELVLPRAPIERTLADAFDASLPSVWAFRAAEVQSEAGLDALLDRHAGRAPAEPAHYVQIRGFGVSETERANLMGDL